MKKRLLSLALALLLVLGVMPMALADEGENTDCGHDMWDAGDVTTVATCETEEVITYHCTKKLDDGSTCTGYITVPGSKNPNNHPSDKLTTVSTTATCIAAGKTTKKCSACNGTVEVDEPALGHDFSNGSCTHEGCKASISISTNSLTLAPGESSTITASAKDYAGTTVNVSLTSGNTAVATVDSTGKVTAVAEGTAAITASATIDGTSAAATCTVTVDSGDVVCESVEVKVGSSTTLAPSLKDGAVNSSDVTWNFSLKSGTAVTVSSNGKIEGDEPGEAIVTVTGTYTVNGTTNTVTKDVYVSAYEDDLKVKAKLKSTVVGSFDFADTGILDSVTYGSTSLSLTTFPTLEKVLGESYATYIDVSELSATYGKIGTLSVSYPGSGDMVSTSLMKNIKFTLNGSSGSQTLSYTLYGSHGLKVGEGELTITTEGFDAAVSYSTYAGTAVTIKESDFASYWKKSNMTGNLDYVEFAVSSTVPLYGTLYTTASTSTRKTVSAAMDFSYDYSSKTDDYDLNTVTYVPLSSTKTYEEEIPFTCYGEKSGQVLDGVMVIKVGLKASFTDVKSSDYFYDAVNWAVSNGITKGTSDTTFSPDLTCTRAEVVTFLWRAAGEPEPTISTTKFTDVDKDDYYYDAVLWAVEKGITEGTSATTFSPKMTVTRAQVVTFLWRSLGKTTVSSVNPFTDIKSSEYYYDAVLWAVKNDVTKGKTDTAFWPDYGCTRSEIVTFLYRAYQ